MKPDVLIPRGLGINSHEELGYMFKLAGANVEEILWNELIAEPSVLDKYDGLGLAGGFAMGDHLGAGQSLANRINASGLREKLSEKLSDPNFPIYAVCNSFQLLAKLDLFPVPVGTVRNESGKHETDFWDLKVNPEIDDVWLRYFNDCTEPIFAPVSHGEGRIIVPSKDLEAAQGLIALTYERGHMFNHLSSSKKGRYNPNGSVGDIAGLAWKNNLVLFPHFERLHHDFQRPDRAEVKKTKGATSEMYQPSYLLFKGAVDFMAYMKERRE